MTKRRRLLILQQLRLYRNKSPTTCTKVHPTCLNSRMVWSFTTRTNKQLDLMHTGLFPLSSKLVNFLKRFLQVFFFLPNAMALPTNLVISFFDSKLLDSISRPIPFLSKSNIVCSIIYRPIYLTKTNFIVERCTGLK